MRRKSRFLTFLLSFIPGLSHFYLGYADRGLIYLTIFGVLSVGSIGLAIISYTDAFLVLLLGVPIIWLVALIDAFSIINNMRYGSGNSVSEDMWSSLENKVSNKKIITLALSMVPGAGHMYLGYQQKGLVLMGGFFFTIFFMGWLNLSVLLFILPLIWFYSFFDAFHILNGSDIGDIKDIDIRHLIPSLKSNYIGIGLIGIGILIILQKILYPVLATYISWQIRNYIQTSIVSLIFIVIGIKMLGKRDIEIEEVEEDIWDEE